MRIVTARRVESANLSAERFTELIRRADRGIQRSDCRSDSYFAISTKFSFVNPTTKSDDTLLPSSPQVRFTSSQFRQVSGRERIEVDSRARAESRLRGNDTISSRQIWLSGRGGFTHPTVHTRVR